MPNELMNFTHEPPKKAQDGARVLKIGDTCLNWNIFYTSELNPLTAIIAF